jgi:ABC-type Fe3+/spermidine/putrescine transport system ATPase subunit
LANANGFDKSSIFKIKGQKSKVKVLNSAMTLNISKLSKRYHDRWILRDVSLEAERGKILGIIGENSCGKSTLLRLISGAEKANSGEIWFEEKNLTDSKERGFSFSGNTKSWKNIFSSSKNSASEQQIESFFRQIENADSVVLLDNPCLCLDQNGRQKVFAELRKSVAEKNLAIVLATNNEEEIFSLCHQVAVLNDGYVAQTGTPREVYQSPNSVASARALGRCNLLVSRRVTFNNQNSLEFQTLTGDHRLQVDKAEKAALGAITNNVSLAIRPEHISISFGASFPEDNLLKAQIAAIEYQGATTRLFLDANGLILEALVLRLVGLNIGDECMVGLPPDRILVLKS